MIFVPKRVFWVGPASLQEGLGHEFTDDPDCMASCDFFVGLDSGGARRILVNFALGFMLGLKRRCLVMAYHDDCVAAWRHTETFTLATFKRVDTVEDARQAIAAFLPRHYATHEEYLRSPEWRERRLKVINAWGGKCAVCKDHDQLDVHHNTYSRVGHELDTDLVPLCRSCHVKFHGH